MITYSDKLINPKDKKVEVDINFIPFADDFILEEDVFFEHNIELFNELEVIYL